LNHNGKAVVRAVGATKIYGSGEAAVRALDDVTVEFPAGRFTAIMGPSGSGKSTLMHCVAGLDDLTSGQVFLGDVELGKLSDKERCSSPTARSWTPWRSRRPSGSWTA
jgi:putative ABC transport system ATP-binding protein